VFFSEHSVYYLTQWWSKPFFDVIVVMMRLHGFAFPHIAFFCGQICEILFFFFAHECCLVFVNDSLAGS